MEDSHGQADIWAKMGHQGFPEAIRLDREVSRRQHVFVRLRHQPQFSNTPTICCPLGESANQTCGMQKRGDKGTLHLTSVSQ